jgi:hypothetical protein
VRLNVLQLLAVGAHVETELHTLWLFYARQYRADFFFAPVPLARILRVEIIDDVAQEQLLV